MAVNKVYSDDSTGVELQVFPDSCRKINFAIRPDSYSSSTGLHISLSIEDIEVLLLDIQENLSILKKQ